MKEEVVLVDENNNPVGAMPKSAVHGKDTPLHRGFSVFLFNKKGELLLQQRALSKITWPGIWSNSCCGHPLPGESTRDAALRRLSFELGLQGVELIEILPNYRYRFEKEGVVENEICPVFAGFMDKTPVPNPEEVGDTKWVSWPQFVEDIQKQPGRYSPWCEEEAFLLVRNNAFNDLYGYAIERKKRKKAKEVI